MPKGRSDILDLGSWFILRMASADTLAVVKALDKAGFDVWTPIERRRGRMPRTKAVYDKKFALMPSYAFASVHDLPSIHHLAVSDKRDMPHFTLFQAKGGIPLLADDQLDGLRAEEARLQRVYDKACKRGVKGPKFNPGHIVRISEGGFAGMDGIVEDQQGQFTLVSFAGFHSPIKIASLLLVDGSVTEHAEIAVKAA